jgi:caffeoyl-CoA O-methyltransferase
MTYQEHQLFSAPARSVLDRLRDDDQRQRELGLPVDERTRNVTAPTGLFLYSLVRSVRPQLIVEIGSSTAYSTIWMALAAREFSGRIIGSEILPDRAAKANQNLVQAAVSEIATVEAGDGSAIAAEFDAVDMVFLDAEKDDYPRHFGNVVGRVRSGGLILTDNVTSHDCSSLLEMIRQRSDVVTQTLPFERGLEYTIKL